LIRALVASTACVPACGEGWLINEESRLRLVGYGVASAAQATWSTRHAVRLVAEGVLEEKRFHLYRLPLPENYRTIRGRRGITIALAYNPPMRASRKAYLARTMSIEVAEGLTGVEVEGYYKKPTGEQEDGSRIPGSNVLDLRPAVTSVRWSTLQARWKVWQRTPKWKVNSAGETDLFLIVSCQHRFPIVGDGGTQPYALVVNMWHEDAQVEIYQSLRTLARVVLPTRVRI
jgi:hypothetical protein